MLRRGSFPLLAVVALFVGCGGGEPDSATPGSTDTSPDASSETLDFDQVEGFTIEQLEGEAGIQECEELAWVEDKQQKRLLAPFKQTKRVELLACDGVPYLAYIEYGDASEAEKSLAAALLPYLVAGERTVVIPLAGIEEPVAADYLASLMDKCGCGEIVKPGRKRGVATK